MHTALENVSAYVAQNVPGPIAKVDDATFQGSSARMDLVICNALTGGLQTLYADVTMGTAVCSREYAGMPRDGARSEPGWRSAAAFACERTDQVRLARAASRRRGDLRRGLWRGLRGFGEGD